MRRPVDHTTLSAVGYFAALGVEAGGQAHFHLSTIDSDAQARVVRLDRDADDQSAWSIARTDVPLAARGFEPGSFLAIPLDDRFQSGWTLAFEFRLAEPPSGRSLIAGEGFSLRFDADGALRLQSGESATGQNLPVRQWLNARICSRNGRLSFAVTGGREALIALAVAAPEIAPLSIRVGADREGAGPAINMAVGRITLHDVEDWIAAAWRFPPVGRPARLAPVEGSGVLEIHNAPTFAVRSSRWDGSVLDPRLAPDHYDAVALHDDDLAEAGWPETHRIAVPQAARSGVYALEIMARKDTTRWPFFVTPRDRQAELAFLVPTFTYLAYANERLPPDRFPWLCDDIGHRFAKANGLTSLYDTHNDGSGVSLASFHRPLATLRDDYRYPLCGTPHLLPVDLNLLRFLHAQGIDVDILTDGDLHDAGLARLQGYRGLVTGSHPEYWTTAMRDKLVQFRDQGGHIAYLGGNGGYWVTACDGPTIEVRRGLSGIRTWNSAPGETHLAMTGEPGGLWRHRGRPEHELLGVGLQAMGFSQAQAFRRMPDSYSPALAWLFEGVSDGPIGTEGLVLGGAAGYEIDARSARWNTPAHTRLLAVAEGFDAGYAVDSDATEDGLPVPARGEMTLTESQSGSMVFAASSVSWCGALPQAGTMNDVGRITLNFLRRIMRDRSAA